MIYSGFKRWIENSFFNERYLLLHKHFHFQLTHFVHDWFLHDKELFLIEADIQWQPAKEWK